MGGGLLDDDRRGGSCDAAVEESKKCCGILGGDFGDVMKDVSSIERDVVVIGGGDNLDCDADVDIDDANILSSSLLLPP